MKKKKRDKKYRQKPVRTPTVVFRVWPELTKGQKAEADLLPFVHLEALRKGEGTRESVPELQCALRHAWILSQGFEGKFDLRMLFLLAHAALNHIAQRQRAGETTLPETLFEPVERALAYLQEMKDSLSRVELISSLRATMDSGALYSIADGAAWWVDPTDTDWRRLLNRRGCAVINGKARSGYLQTNEEMGNRLEWVVPIEDWLIVPITKPFVLVLTEPVEDQEK